MAQIVIKDQLAALLKEIRAQTAKVEVVSATLDRITAKLDWVTVKPVIALGASSTAAATSMVSPVQPAAATSMVSPLDVHDAVPPSSGHSSVTTHTAELVSELPARCATPALVHDICRLPDAGTPLCTRGAYAPSMGAPTAPERPVVASLELDKQAPIRCLVLGAAALNNESMSDDALDDKSGSVPVAWEAALLAELHMWTVPKPNAPAHTRCSTKCYDFNVWDTSGTKLHTFVSTENRGIQYKMQVLRPLPWPSFVNDNISFQLRPPWPSFKAATRGKLPSRTVMNLFQGCSSCDPRVTQIATQQQQCLEIDLQVSSGSPVLSWFAGGKQSQCLRGAELLLDGKDGPGNTNIFEGVGLVIGRRDAVLHDATGLPSLSPNLRLFRVVEWKGADNCKRLTQHWYHTVQSARTHFSHQPSIIRIVHSTAQVSVRGRKCLNKTQCKGILNGRQRELKPWPDEQHQCSGSVFPLSPLQKFGGHSLLGKSQKFCDNAASLDMQIIDYLVVKGSRAFKMLLQTAVQTAPHDTSSRGGEHQKQCHGSLLQTAVQNAPNGHKKTHVWDRCAVEQLESQQRPKFSSEQPKSFRYALFADLSGGVNTTEPMPPLQSIRGENCIADELHCLSYGLSWISPLSMCLQYEQQPCCPWSQPVESVLRWKKFVEHGPVTAVAYFLTATMSKNSGVTNVLGTVNQGEQFTDPSVQLNSLEKFLKQHAQARVRYLHCSSSVLGWLNVDSGVLLIWGLSETAYRLPLEVPCSECPAPNWALVSFAMMWQIAWSFISGGSSSGNMKLGGNEILIIRFRRGTLLGLVCMCARFHGRQPRPSR